MRMHLCKKCNETKPVSEFFVYKDTGTIKNECKQCKRDREKRNKDKKRLEKSWINIIIG